MAGGFKRGGGAGASSLFGRVGRRPFCPAAGRRPSLRLGPLRVLRPGSPLGATDSDLALGHGALAVCDRGLAVGEGQVGVRDSRRMGREQPVRCGGRGQGQVASSG